MKRSVEAWFAPPSPMASRFLMIKPLVDTAPQSGANQVNDVLNSFEELRQCVPAGKD